MSDLTALTIHIPGDLKGRLKAYAKESGESLSSVSERLLTTALDAADTLGKEGPLAADVDSPYMREDGVKTLTGMEIKALRKLLRNKT